MLAPKRVKYRKPHKGRNRGQAARCNTLSFGQFAIQCLEQGRLTSRQLEASRIAIARSIKRGGKILDSRFPQKSVTKKAAETRMGSGKGNPEYWVAVVKPGTLVFEMDGVTKDVATLALNLARHKLPVKTKIISREEVII